ncbi:uncharacterized protein LOC112510342 [Cynara cardunculus var. scolymus]|uniref:uncharacterized protein LOC112510342 n=1 Tax=Cynara cardunculus var. scolymus TaxID=59895 RepID=UPI000D628A95|nr:uncharacterized protein LOC112510342 [Cynara cardunculus var. scolymus]
MSADDWLSLAMADTHLVAELLLRLRLPLPPSKRSRPSPPQSWTIHQRRSRTQPLLPPSNKSEAPRASPSTPLSWSGATSISGGGGGGGGIPIVDVVDSTQPNPNRSVISRSKVTPPGETTPTKRPRKKKTLAALKEEESLLMEEQKHLKMKLETLKATCEKQIKENESLQKMKCGFLELDIQVEPQLERQERNNHFEAVKERKDKLVLPDLNDPAGEDVTMSY